MKIKREHVDYATLGVLLVIILSLFTSIFGSQVGYTLVVIDNPDPNSMWPTYFQGDLFLIYKTDAGDIHIGDVVVYQKSGSEVKVIHRVIDIVIDNGNYYYRVKGDNFITNQTPDSPGGSTLIPYSEIVGKTILRLPFIGHLSLSMQRNITVMILVYFIAGAAVIAILMWPEDEEDEKKEKYIEISRNSLRLWLIGILTIPRTLLNIIKTSKHRNLIILACIALIIILITPIFAASLLSTDEPNKIGVIRVSEGKYQPLSDSIGQNTYNSDFIQMEVELVDNAGMWKRIKSFDLEVFSESSYQNLLSHTKWNSFKDFKGRVVIGASIVIPQNLQPTNGSTVYVKITLDIITAFIFHDNPIFEYNFQYFQN